MSSTDLATYERFIDWLLVRYKPVAALCLDDDDVRQEARLAGWLALRSWDQSRGLPRRHWVASKMRFRVMELARPRARATSTTSLARAEAERYPAEFDDLALTVESTESTVIARDELGRLAHALHELPPKQQACVRAAANGQTIPAMNISTFHSQVSKGRSRLRIALAA